VVCFLVRVIIFLFVVCFVVGEFRYQVGFNIVVWFVVVL